MSEYEEQDPGWRNIEELTEEEREFALERFIEEESLSEQALDASIRDSRLSVYLPFEELKHHTDQCRDFSEPNCGTAW